MRRMNRREFSHSVAATAGISLLRHPGAEAAKVPVKPGVDQSLTCPGCE